MTETKTAQPNAAGLPVLEGLFGSKSRARLLTVFVSHPAEEFYAQRLTTMTRLAESSVRYELGRLERLGVLVARRGGREKYFRINDRHPLLPELKQMVYKTAGLGETIRQAVDGMPNVHAAFVFGSVAKEASRPRPTSTCSSSAGPIRPDSRPCSAKPKVASGARSTL